MLFKRAYRLGHAQGNCHSTDKYARKTNARDRAEIAEMNRALENGDNPTMEEWLERCNQVAGTVENGKMQANPTLPLDKLKQLEV